VVHKVTLIPGDGVGPELTAAATRVLEATGVKFEWEEQLAGADVAEETGTPLPAKVLESIRRNKVALKGPITTPIGTGFRSVNVALRHELGLYACLRPCISYPGVRSRYSDVDIVVVRENTEDLYAGVEFAGGSTEAETIRNWAPNKIRAGSAISIKSASIEASRRIVEHAFEYALANNRRKVTAVAKANIMKPVLRWVYPWSFIRVTRPGYTTTSVTPGPSICGAFCGITPQPILTFSMVLFPTWKI
jgi:isocitrate dehydrogenase (NAD+)